jgi:transposase-like protein
MTPTSASPTITPDPVQSEIQTAEFARIVSELKTVALRGQEAIQRSVALINEYQTRFGKSRAALAKLADAVGVNVSTLYAWKKQVEKPAASPKKPKSRESQTSSFYVIRRKSDGVFYRGEGVFNAESVAEAHQIRPDEDRTLEWQVNFIFKECHGRKGKRFHVKADECEVLTVEATYRLTAADSK